jgi:hypothetical protein
MKYSHNIPKDLEFLIHVCVYMCVHIHKTLCMIELILYIIYIIKNALQNIFWFMVFFSLLGSTPFRIIGKFLFLMSYWDISSS